MKTWGLPSALADSCSVGESGGGGVWVLRSSAFRNGTRADLRAFGHPNRNNNDDDNSLGDGRGAWLVHETGVVLLAVKINDCGGKERMTWLTLLALSESGKESCRSTWWWWCNGPCQWRGFPTWLQTVRQRVSTLEVTLELSLGVSVQIRGLLHR